MIKVYVRKNNIVITGHAGFNDYGKDIVCASASSIAITSINACLNIDAKRFKLIRQSPEDKRCVKNFLRKWREVEKNIKKAPVFLDERFLM